MKNQRRKRRPNSHRAHRTNNLGFQKLEPKHLLAGISFDGATGIVTIDGSNVGDAVQIQSVSATQINVVFGGVESRLFDVSQVSEIVFFGRNGNDWFKNNTPVASRAYGQAGDDILVGGSNDDRLRGGDGDDRLSGRDGDDYIGGDGADDILIGGEGNDRIDGLYGNDRIWGESGDDFIIAGAGDDFADGGSGDDRIYGYTGDDQLKGGDGDDYIAGHAGSDWISGSGGDDTLFGNDGRDQVFGSFGDDEIYGGNDADDLRGHQGRDALFGGSGNDDLYGGSEADRLVGGNGNDDFYDDRFDQIFDDADDYSLNGDFEIRGNLSNLNSAAKTFTLLGITVNYSGAEFVDDIQDGSFVKAEGAYDGTVLQAHEVENESDDGHDNFEARGTVSNLDTSAQTFRLLGFTIDYSSAQVHVQPIEGQPVSVEGQLNGSQVIAREIEIGIETGDSDDDSDDDRTDGDLELRGLVTEFDATASTFRLLGLSVNFSSAQVTGQFANGSFVKVDGTFNGTTFTAREVELEVNDGRDENFEAQGVISNLDTGSMQFEVLGFTVNYEHAQVTTPLINGQSFEIEGWYANLVVDADEIK